MLRGTQCVLQVQQELNCGWAVASVWLLMWPPSHGGHRHMHAMSGLMWATRQCDNKYPFSGVTVCGCTMTVGGKLALEWAIAGSWITQLVIGMIFCALLVCGWGGLACCTHHVTQQRKSIQQIRYKLAQLSHLWNHLGNYAHHNYLLGMFAANLPVAAHVF